jgi:hypothetical protein
MEMNRSYNEELSSFVIITLKAICHSQELVGRVMNACDYASERAVAREERGLSEIRILPGC